MIKIDLKGNPFYLGDEEIKWVEGTLSKLSIDEKIGQIFFMQGFANKKEDLVDMMEVVKPGGVMFRPGPSHAVAEAHTLLQDHANIPLFLAANLEMGANGLISDGTSFATNMLVGATNNEDCAYKLGLVCGEEAAAVGGNMAFAPVIDIDFNWRNPITNTRTFGSCPELVSKMGRGYLRGTKEAGVCVTIKHFPGDGMDTRDQHLLTTVNDMEPRDWDETYGKVYQDLINDGARGLMVGHIALPKYLKEINPECENHERLPATLSKDLINGLLRDKLGYNGLIMTDATLMAGFGMYGRREDIVPMSIAAGNDMFLFTKNYREDLKFMKQGYEKGILSEERIDEAVTRILALKAAIGLHKNLTTEELVPNDQSKVSHDTHKQWAREAADLGVTLVKDEQDILPIDKSKVKNILLFKLGNKSAGMMSDAKNPLDDFADKLQAKGFNVDERDYGDMMNNIVYMFESIEDKKDKYDLVLYVANKHTSSNQTHLRIGYESPIGLDAPWFVEDIPTVFVSLANPYHMYDVPMIKTFVNGYCNASHVIDAIIGKILGESAFKGQSPVNAHFDLAGNQILK